VTPQELIDGLRKFRDDIRRKPEDDRTKREELIIEAAVALEDLLLKYHAAPSHSHDIERPADGAFLTVLKGMNEVNREYDLRDADIRLAATLRKGARHGDK